MIEHLNASAGTLQAITRRSVTIALAQLDIQLPCDRGWLISYGYNSSTNSNSLRRGRWYNHDSTQN